MNESGAWAHWYRAFTPEEIRRAAMPSAYTGPGNKCPFRVTCSNPSCKNPARHEVGWWYLTSKFGNVAHTSRYYCDRCTRNFRARHPEARKLPPDTSFQKAASITRIAPPDLAPEGN